MVFIDNQHQDRAGKNIQEAQKNTIKATALLAYAIAKKLIDLAKNYALEKVQLQKDQEKGYLTKRETQQNSQENEDKSYAENPLDNSSQNSSNNKINNDLNLLGSDRQANFRQINNEKIEPSASSFTQIESGQSGESGEIEPEVSKINGGSFTIEKLLELEKNKENMTTDYKNAMQIAKTANLIAKKSGQKQDKNLVADGKHYRIVIDNSEKEKPVTTVYSHQNNERILEADSLGIYYRFSDHDVNKFKEIAQAIEQNKNQDLER